MGRLEHLVKVLLVAMDSITLTTAAVVVVLVLLA
jgi:hypothetical protein